MIGKTLKIKLIPTFLSSYQILILTLVLYIHHSDGSDGEKKKVLEMKDALPENSKTLTAQLIQQRFDEINVLSGVNIVQKCKFDTIEVNAFAQMKKLTVFKAIGNELGSIEEKTFSSAANLAEINLKNNKITEIAEKSFENMKHLVKIDLTGNKLTSIKDLGLPRGIKYFSISSNPIGAVMLSMFIEYKSLQHLHATDIYGTIIFSSKSEGSLSVTELKLSTKNGIDVDETSLIEGLKPFRGLQTLFLKTKMKTLSVNMGEAQIFALWPRLTYMNVNGFQHFFTHPTAISETEHAIVAESHRTNSRNPFKKLYNYAMKKLRQSKHKKRE